MKEVFVVRQFSKTVMTTAILESIQTSGRPWLVRKLTKKKTGATIRDMD